MARADITWEEIGASVFRHRFASLDLNIGVVIGDDEVLLIDTRSGPREAAELRQSIRTLTSLPVRQVVNTHFHFDHTFGNAEFSAARIWGHERCARVLHQMDGRDIAHLARMFPAVADDICQATMVPPDQLVAEAALLSVGGRRIELHHLGRGHTDGDLIVAVPDAGVVFAGDLIEQSGEPDFHDGWPLEWPSTVVGLIRLGIGVLVPGHGDVMNLGDVTAQAEQLVDMAHLCALCLRGGMSDEGVLRRAPFDPRTAIVALHRARVTLARLPQHDWGPSERLA